MMKAGEIRPRLLRLAQAARYLSVSPGTLRRLIQQGRLPVIKMTDSEGGNVPWLIDIEDLNQFIAYQKEHVLP